MAVGWSGGWWWRRGRMGIEESGEIGERLTDLSVVVGLERLADLGVVVGLEK